MDFSLKRYELEDYVEAQLLEIAESLIPDSPGSDDLKAATDSFPEHFGGKFPHLGLAVVRTQGSRPGDKPTWPASLSVEVRIYHPCLPYNGAKNPTDDRTGPARRITRRLRGMFLEELILSRFGRQPVEAPDSRGGWIDELGRTAEAEYNRATWHLWIDRTDLLIKV